MGVPMKDRGGRLDDYIRGWRAAWSGETEYTSGHFSFTGVKVKPQPADHVPIWVGGSSAGALRRAAWCDGWHGTWAPVDVFADRLARLHHEVDELARPRSAVTVSIHMEVTLGADLPYSGWSKVGDGYGDRRPVTGSVDDVVELLAEYEDAGLQHVLATPVVRGVEAWDTMVDALAEVASRLRRKR